MLTNVRYSAAVLSRVKDPKHVGWLPREASDVGTGEAGSLERGTLTRIQVRIDAHSERIEQAVFKVFGCSAAIASASLVTERLIGVAMEQVQTFDGMAVVAELELPIERAGVAALAVEAAQAAVRDWQGKKRHVRDL